MSIGLSIGLHLGRGGAGSASNVPINNYVGMVGASSVANGGDMTGLAQLVSGTNVAGVQFWGIVLSDGGLCWAGAAATGGYTVQQVYDTHWPTMRDAEPKRGFVGFFAGTNDTDAMGFGGVVQTAAIATRKEVVRSFIREARANGQVPFVVAPQPNETSVEGIAAMPAWRLALIALCAEETCIFADVFAALGDPNTGLWLDDAYTEAGNPAADLHIGPLGGPLAGQAITDALTPFRNPNHNPQFVSTGDDTSGWAWLGGRFPDPDTDGSPDGGGTSLVTDAWSAPSGTATRVVTAGTGDIDGNWFGINKTGTPTTSSTSLSPVTAPGAVPLTVDDVYEVAYHLDSTVDSATAGFGLKLGVGSDYFLYHRGIRADAPIEDKIIWALHSVHASVPALNRWTFGTEVTASNADLGLTKMAMLSLKNITEAEVPAAQLTNSDGGDVLNSSGGQIFGA